jgi:hypothetical protein
MRKWRVLTGVSSVVVAILAMITWAGASVGPPVLWTVLTVLLVAAFIWLYRRPSPYPDLLGQVSRKYFERNGFCFSIGCVEAKGRCELIVHYQNRYANPAQAVLVLNRPRRSFRKATEPSVSIGFEYGGGEFGATRVPWAVDEQLQGKTDVLEVAADVRYPQGKGRMIRYRDGLRVGTAKGANFQVAATVAAAMAGFILISRPARVRLRYPTGVSQSVPDRAAIKSEVLWEPGAESNDGSPRR